MSYEATEKKSEEMERLLLGPHVSRTRAHGVVQKVGARARQKQNVQILNSRHVRASQALQPPPEGKVVMSADEILVNGRSKREKIGIKVAKIITAQETSDGVVEQKKVAVATALGKNALFSLIMVELLTLRMFFARYITFLADGAKWIWKRGEQTLESADFILDWWHLWNNVKKTMRVLYPGRNETSARRRRKWYKILKPLLWQGEWKSAIAHLKKLRFKKFEKVAAIGALVNYIQSNGERIWNYAMLFDSNKPISSAIVEGECNRLIAKRLKKKQQMHWSRRGANNIVTLRMFHINGRWDELFHAKAA